MHFIMTLFFKLFDIVEEIKFMSRGHIGHFSLNEYLLVNLFIIETIRIFQHNTNNDPTVGLLMLLESNIFHDRGLQRGAVSLFQT